MSWACPAPVQSWLFPLPVRVCRPGRGRRCSAGCRKGGGAAGPAWDRGAEGGLSTVGLTAVKHRVGPVTPRRGLPRPGVGACPACAPRVRRPEAAHSPLHVTRRVGPGGGTAPPPRVARPRRRSLLAAERPRFPRARRHGGGAGGGAGAGAAPRCRRAPAALPGERGCGAGAAGRAQGRPALADRARYCRWRSCGRRWKRCGRCTSRTRRTCECRSQSRDGASRRALAVPTSRPASL